MPKYVEIAVPISLAGTFHYSVPDGLDIHPGSAVMAPFGPRRVTGYAVSFIGEEEVLRIMPARKVRSILGADKRNPGLPETMLPLAKWLAHECVAGLGETIETMIPAAVRRGVSEQEELWVSAAVPRSKLPELVPELARKARKQAAVVELLAESVDDALPLGVVARESGAGRASIKALAAKGVLQISRRPVDDPLMLAPPDTTPPPTLTGEQREALDRILAARARPGTAVLLEGITGSGKTEVYLRAIAEVVKSGRQAVVLVPEISLTPQTVERFRGRFSRIAVLHSQLTDGQRAAHYRAIREGLADVVVGARSAVFAPVPRLGIIVMDEEHENSYKEDTSPRYHARAVAIKRAELEGAVVVLGSATPSLESTSAALGGVYSYARLTTRPAGGALPAVEIVDMREETAASKRFVLISRRLARAASDALARGRQVLLFLNRRGFSTQLYCPVCGEVVSCNRCDIPMTYHKMRGKLLCHYCEHTEAPPADCPECSAKQLLYLGTGTERLEEEIAASLPEARIARLDSDVMRKRGAYFEVLSAFRSGGVNVLVGTQVIAKGLDVPGVSLVGVINADVALALGDFRAGERTAQLLCQVAGRAGRRTAEGRVIIQTMNPRNPAVLAAVRHAYHEYAAAEIEDRRQWGYPPATRIARILAQSEDHAAARAALDAIRDAILEQHRNIWEAGKSSFELAGPAPCVHEKVRGRFRFHLLVKSVDGNALPAALWEVSTRFRTKKGVHVTVDVDPQNML